jgi:pyruvate dehydrogenase E1 component
MAAQLIDTLAEDRQEWLESLDYIRREYGEDGVRALLRALQDHALARGVVLGEATLNTPYINTIAPSDQPAYPGDLELEKRLENMLRWNAMAMVLQAQDAGYGVGGHIATYASAATQLEVGFNHCFRARSADYGGDLVMPQPHAAPGIYARAFLEGRLTASQLEHFRRELGEGGGLPSYPHPRALPGFWQVPNASMGLSTPTAIYQARFAKYLENRGLKPANGGRVWCFIGDGEADEPEVLGTISIAARERLDNLVLVVNCNLQRLDGPVRGNGKIIQELERSFRGADWNVIKVIWGSGWDALLAQDHEGVLRRRMEEAVDGDYQYLSVLPGNVQREHWVEGNPALQKMMNSLTDEEIKRIRRGGQDPKKIFAAYQRAMNATGRPTVILIKTVKGDGLGASAQGRNTVHQKKNFSAEERLGVARDLGIPLDDEAVQRAQFYRPDEDSAELAYLRAHRETLGGWLPQRRIECAPLPAPSLEDFAEFLGGSAGREASTTAAMVRMLARLMRHERLGRYIVPIVPDEARTFGMDGLFKVAGIYSPDGQRYTPVDADTLLPYREATDGQILQEGICETGAIASFLAAGTAYAVHGVPTIPFYIFYSIFGFQRVGDMIWAAADMLCRGFLLGGTAGRTTLNGEGLQHQDGHSHVLGSTVPNLRSYDPAFAYELAVIVRDGIEAMYERQEKVFYYLTLYNETYEMPAMPAHVVPADILSGAYCYREAEGEGMPVALLASGSIMQQALEAVALLEARGCSVSLYSVTSYVELAREAEACERAHRREPAAARRVSRVQALFGAHTGACVAVSDYMKALPNSIARWMPPGFSVLGTDGFGISETRETLRDYFEIDARHITRAALVSLADLGVLDAEALTLALEGLPVDADSPDPTAR